MFEKINSPIPHTVAEQFVKENGEKGFIKISPLEGYELHTKGLDYDEIDEEGKFVGHRRGYARGFATCSPKYDFSAHTVKDENGVEYVAYGDREFYTKKTEEDAKWF